MMDDLLGATIKGGTIDGDIRLNCNVCDETVLPRIDWQTGDFRPLYEIDIDAAIKVMRNHIKECKHFKMLSMSEYNCKVCGKPRPMRRDESGRADMVVGICCVEPSP